MPKLDVTDLLYDPDLTGHFDVIRRIQSVNQYGEVSVTADTFEHVIGAVYPTGSNSLTKEAAFQTQAKAITVVTKFRLRGASQDMYGTQYQPDIVEWDGDQYEVKVVNDYSRYGGGFIEAECINIAKVDIPPHYDIDNPATTP